MNLRPHTPKAINLTWVILHQSSEIEAAIEAVHDHMRAQGFAARGSTRGEGFASTPVIEYAVNRLARDLSRGVTIPLKHWTAWADTHASFEGKQHKRFLSEMAADSIHAIGLHMETLPVKFFRLAKRTSGGVIYNRALIMTCALLYVADQKD